MNEIQYFLGHTDWPGYEIVAHRRVRPSFTGSCVFSIKEDWISDGDGCPSAYDYQLYVEVDESVHDTVMKMFQDAVTAIDLIDKAPEQPINRNLQMGDCFYSRSEYFCVKSVEEGRYYVDCISNSRYDLHIFSCEELTEDLEILIDELREDGVFIPKVAFDSAYKIATEAIKNITAYLKDEYLKA